jgi:hypothetical protein
MPIRWSKKLQSWLVISKYGPVLKLGSLFDLEDLDPKTGHYRGPTKTVPTTQRREEDKRK